MRIAVTGATGFVGGALLPRLLAEAHSVKALVRNTVKAGLPKEAIAVKGDLADEAALNQLCDGVDVVLHVAGTIAGLKRDDFFTTNVVGTSNLAKAAAAQKVSRFVHVSSLAAREPDLNHYSASKHEAERALAALARSMQLTILRPAAVYGPGDSATLPLIKLLLSKVALIPGTAAARIGMVHVDDVARSLAEAADAGHPGIFAVDDGEGGHSWDDLIGITRAEFGTPKLSAFIPQPAALAAGAIGDVVGTLRGKPWLVNSDQIRQIYHSDWTVRETRWPLRNPVPLRRGLVETIAWYRANGLLPQHPLPHTRPAPKDTQAQP